ncbi:MAG: ABC transporter permease [Solobacterium sp.]|nr:ABC transporter permease [Solobacterium sp.]
MARYIAKRLLLMIPVLLGVTFLIFALQLITPGDPARLMLGDEATVADIEAWHASHGLNDPFLIQYIKYIWNIITKGDFGISWRTGKSITTEVVSRWPTTFLLALLTTAISVILGLLFGITAAKKRGTWIDSLVRVIAMIGVSMPNFWFALLLILLFSVRLKWLPVSGFYGPKYWILPCMTMGFLGAAGQMRMTRSSYLDNMGADFVRTAKAKGQTEAVITRHHILKNALIPIINTACAAFAMNMGGSTVLEQIFAIPGLGTLMVSAINSRDFPQLRASVILIATTVSVMNLVADILYAAVDPRVKAGFKKSGAKKKKTEKKNTEGEMKHA